jgi:AraC-like DNA-binding protein
MNNLLVRALPNTLLMGLKDAPTLSSTLSLLFDEAELQQCWRQAAIDRFFEYYSKQQWKLESLAKQAGMSRARFDVHFRDTVGTTPVDYLTQRRMGVARTLLKKGNSIGVVANDVCYSNASIFPRVFKAKVG